MNKIVHNIRGSFLVRNEVSEEKTTEAVHLASYWGPQKTITLGGVLMHNGTSVVRLHPADEGYLPLAERAKISRDPLHDLPDIGKYVLPRDEAAKLILSDNYEG